MAQEMKGRVVGGEGKEPEVDGGYVKPANVKAHRRDRRLTRNQNGKRWVVVVRGGNSVPGGVHPLSYRQGHGRPRRRSGVMR